jgi:hypothetical protein
MFNVERFEGQEDFRNAKELRLQVGKGNQGKPTARADTPEL